MIKNSILLSLLIVLVSGCSASINNAQKNDKEKYIKYDNTNHIVGEKDKAIETLFYNELINGKQDVKITFYIDKFPYKKKFNLCKDKQTYKRLKSVTQMENGPDKLEYETVKVNCNSYIEVFKNYDNNMEGRYSFNLLNGFNINRSLKHDMLLESTLSRTDSHSFFGKISSSWGYDGTSKIFWKIKQ